MATFQQTKKHGRLAESGKGVRSLFPGFRHRSIAVEARHASPLRTPRLVQWMVTARCPLSCPHCLAACEHPPEEMSLEEAAVLIEQVAALGVEEFLLTGGEPLARQDIPEIISMLRANGVRWSLNTAISPNSALRRAIEGWPPAFVAVSLDGPEEVHDSFRGRAGAFRDALDSISYFAEITPRSVAAGTTVTTQNFGELPTTFGAVLESGASTWGIHLLIPEGRAAYRKDLFLSRSQLKQLMRFVAAKRNHFPVVMADEIGYCGHWEPLLRSEPFFCGAGKAQCVVLPDGEVVPCTTTDRSTSAGNVLRKPLAEIWVNGFSELREWKPAGKCGRCSYASACAGGCWLQRRHGTACFKDVWHAPINSRALLAVCVGLALAGPMPTRTASAAEPEITVAAQEEMYAATMEVLQRHIILWYAALVGGPRTMTVDEVRESAAKTIAYDPGGRYFLTFLSVQRPDDLSLRAKEIEEALLSKQRSLCLIGLAWRDITEWCLDAKRPGQRTAEERRILRETMTKLGAAAEEWREEIFRDKLDPFLRRPARYRGFFISKAGPPADARLRADLATKRGWTKDDITPAFLAEHPYAEVMTLSFDIADAPGLRCLRAGVEIPADGKLGVFDMLLVPPHVREAKAAPAKIKFTLGAQVIETVLPAQTELSYADVLRLTWEQNMNRLEQAIGYNMSATGNARGLALPILRAKLSELRAAEQTKKMPPRIRELMWHLADIYLF